MSDLVPWIVPLLLGAFFLLAAGANAAVVMPSRRNRTEARSASMVPFVGGVAGALAFSTAPNETLNSLAWLPLFLDIGCAPYLVLVGVVTFEDARRSGTWRQHVPFLRYLYKVPVVEREIPPKERTIIGCLLGTAVGDAMGLAYEGLSARRQRRIYPQIAGYRLLLNKGLTSDDTEHTCMLAQSLIETGNYPPDMLEHRFRANFAWRLRFWLLGLPAGVGLATGRAILKLWLGFPSRASGVFSAGNAPAMRSALIGVCYGEDQQKMRALVRAATRVTHTDPKAEYGALAVALAAHLAATRAADIAPREYLDQLVRLTGNEPGEFIAIIRSVAESVERGEGAADFLARIGCAKGVTGYVYHTVPAALQVWLSHQNDYRDAIIEVIRLGGDTDTTAAIVGAIAGARAGKSGIPQEWLDDLWEWPRTVAWMERLGMRLAERCSDGAVSAGVPVSALKLLVRNAFFLAVVLLHGFRRLLPPY